MSFHIFITRCSVHAQRRRMCRRLAYLARGFTAIGTTSFRGLVRRAPGACATRGANIALAARPGTALQCYVSVDIEDGYSEPDAIADYVAQLSTAGIQYRGR